MHGEKISGEEQLVFGSSICHIKCGEKNSIRNGEKIQEKNGEKNLGKNQEKNVEKKMQDGDIGKCRKNFENETQKKIWG